MICEFCDTPLIAGQTNCPNCGAAQSVAPSINASAPPSIQASSPINIQDGFQPSDKSKVVAALLGFFLGAFGIHNFYIGRKGRGVTQVLLTVLTCGYAGIFVWIWAAIESAILLGGTVIDGNGRQISN